VMLPTIEMSRSTERQVKVFRKPSLLVPEKRDRTGSNYPCHRTKRAPDMWRAIPAVGKRNASSRYLNSRKALATPNRMRWFWQREHVVQSKSKAP